MRVTAGSGPVEAPTPGRLLLVDDDPMVLASLDAWLSDSGYLVRAVTSGHAAVDALGHDDFDVILSDISMSSMDGIELLRAIRSHDLDVPVVLFTGNPSVESASRAVEYGAFKYLVKPVRPADLNQVVERAVRIRRFARTKREALLAVAAPGTHAADRAGLEGRFAAAFRTLWVAFQPIVSWSERRAVAYECFVRNDEPTLAPPPALLDAAVRLGRLRELGRSLRAAVAARIGEAGGADLFVNLHPDDLADDELFDPRAPLSRVSRQVVLEITERASLDGLGDVRRRVAELRQLGFRIALDDLGAGYAGLSSFTLVEPEVVKLDMSLVRGLDADPVKRRVVRSMVGLCAELDVAVVAEGIETAAERDAAVRLGCDRLQGYLFARPGRTPTPPVLGSVP